MAQALRLAPAPVAPASGVADAAAVFPGREFPYRSPISDSVFIRPRRDFAAETWRLFFSTHIFILPVPVFFALIVPRLILQFVLAVMVPLITVPPPIVLVMRAHSR